MQWCNQWMRTNYFCAKFSGTSQSAGNDGIDEGKSTLSVFIFNEVEKISIMPYLLKRHDIPCDLLRAWLYQPSFQYWPDISLLPIAPRHIQCSCYGGFSSCSFFYHVPKYHMWGIFPKYLPLLMELAAMNEHGQQNNIIAMLIFSHLFKNNPDGFLNLTIYHNKSICTNLHQKYLHWVK